jgi:hypothetical protein
MARHPGNSALLISYANFFIEVSDGLLRPCAESPRTLSIALLDVNVQLIRQAHAVRDGAANGHDSHQFLLRPWILLP